MAIKELITLEGAEEIKKTIADLGKTGEDFVKKLNAAGTSATAGNAGMQSFFTGIKTGTQSVTQHSQSVHGLTDAYRFLNPILNEAGIHMSGFRGYAALARLGLEGVAAAITAVVTIAFAQLADSVRVTRAELDNLLNLPKGSKTSQNMFAGLETDAKKLGMTVDELLPVIQSWLAAVEKVNTGGPLIVTAPGHSPPEIIGKGYSGARDAVLAFLAALRTGGEDIAKATADATAFGKAMQTNKVVNGDVVRSLNPLGAGIRTLQQAFGMTGISVEEFARRLDASPKTINDLIFALGRLQPELLKALDSGTPTAFGDALHKVKVEWGDLFRDIAGSDFAVWFLGIVARMPDDAKAAWDAIRTDVNDLVEFMKTTFQAGKDFIVGLFTGASWAGIFDGMKMAASDVINWLMTQWQTFWNWLRTNQIQTTSTSIPGAGVPIVGSYMATGGLFHGRPGVDTNLAWLTHLEYVMSPAAVRKYGSHFMDMINNLQFPVRGFAEGGLNLVPDRANTGTSNLRPLVLNIPGFGSFKGSISAPDRAVEILSRASTFHQFSRGGKEPGWRR